MVVYIAQKTPYDSFAEQYHPQTAIFPSSSSQPSNDKPQVICCCWLGLGPIDCTRMAFGIIRCTSGYMPFASLGFVHSVYILRPNDTGDWVYYGLQVFFTCIEQSMRVEFSIRMLVKFLTSFNQALYHEALNHDLVT